VHHVGILYGQFMMHGQRNIKLGLFTRYLYMLCREIFEKKHNLDKDILARK